MLPNSPLIAGRDSGWLDFRYQVWRETDTARCGLLEQMLEKDWGYRRYVECERDVPMLFVRSGTEYRDARQQTFRHWLTTGRLAGGAKGEAPPSHRGRHLNTP